MTEDPMLDGRRLVVLHKPFSTALLAETVQDLLHGSDDASLDRK
jgi:hypothetical protein